MKVPIRYTLDVDPANLGPEGPGGSSNEIFEVVQEVKDARASCAKLDVHGFELVECKTALSTDDFVTNDGKVIAVYYPEVAKFVEAHMGAAKVIPFHHQVRSAESADQGGKVKPVAGAAHLDYNMRTARSLFDDLGSSTMTQGRFAIVNAWRSISEQPVANDHLAMCDARTIVAPDDFVAIGEDSEGKDTYRLHPGRSECHDWYYFPHMAKNEVLIFMQFDSDSTSAARFAFHSSVHDATVQSGPARQSIELRCLALFPNHVPNTIPQNFLTGDTLVGRAVRRMLTALNYPDHWGEKGKAFMVSTLHTAGAETTLWLIVEDAGRKGEHGVDKLSTAQREELVRTLLKNGWGEKAKQAFGGNFTEAAAQQLLIAVSHPEAWGQQGRDWAASQLMQQNGAKKMADQVVARWVQEGKHGLAGASQHQQAEVVKAAMDRGFDSVAKAHFIR